MAVAGREGTRLMQNTDQSGAGRGVVAAAGRGDALRARRGAAVAVVTPPAEDDTERVGKRGRAQALLTGPDAAQHRKALNRVMRILSETPADATGLVEGTSFTKAGVKALVDMLTKRTTDPDAAGAKMAGGLLKLLTAVGKDGTEDTRVHGVLVARLQQLGRSTDALRRRAKNKTF